MDSILILFQILLLWVARANSFVDLLGQSETEQGTNSINNGNSSDLFRDESDYAIGHYDSYEEEQDDWEVDEQMLKEFADIDVDDFGDFFFRARWSYAPGFVEKLCRKKCQENGKPFGRLLGTRCRCYCPLNAGELSLCELPGKCDKFCSSIRYFKGGDCVFNNVCFCYCKPTDEYNVYAVYTLGGTIDNSNSTTESAAEATEPTTTTTTTRAPITFSTRSTTTARPIVADTGLEPGQSPPPLDAKIQPNRPHFGRPRPRPKRPHYQHRLADFMSISLSRRNQL